MSVEERSESAAQWTEPIPVKVVTSERTGWPAFLWALLDMLGVVAMIAFGVALGIIIAVGVLS